MRRAAMGFYALLWMGAAFAADKPELGPVPSWVQPYQWRRDAGPETGAAVKILLSDQQLNFTAEGDDSYIESVVKIQTPQGLGAMGTLTLAWNPATDTMVVHKVHIVRGDQVINVLEGNEPFTILRRENNLEYASLDGILTAVIQPPGLQVGDIVDMAVTLRRADPVLVGASQQIVVLPSEQPVAHGQIRARWPSSSPMRWKASDALRDVKVYSRHGVTELSIDLHDLQPLTQPKGAPFGSLVDRRIEFTNFRSWSDVAERLAPLYETAATLAADSPLHGEIARIKAATPDPAARAAAALRLVQDQVRYVFLGMNEGGMVPANADLTWSRRFGDCKAKTALLVALLRGLDIPADPVAVSSLLGGALKNRLPMIGAFDHVIARATIDGKTHWLDGARAGDRSLQHIVTPAYVAGLPLVAKNADLVSIMPEPLQEPLVATSVRIDATGGIDLPAPFHGELVLRGDAATALRLQLGNLTPTDLDRALRQIWTTTYRFVDVTSVAARFEEDTGREILSMDGNARMDWSGSTYTPEGLMLGFNADFERPPGPNHDAPFAVPYPSFQQASETILLPYRGREFRVEGGEIDQTVAGIEYRRKASIKDGVFTAIATTRSVAPEFPSTEAAAAQQSLREMAKKSLYVRAPADYVPTEKEMAAELATEPSDAGGYVKRGGKRLDQSDYIGAIADYDKALELEPANARALADRGITHYWMQKPDLARQDFDAAFALDPRNAVVFRGRGMLATSNGNFEEAIEHYSKSLELDPKNRFALEERADAYARTQQYEKSLSDLTYMIRIHPAYLKTYLLRADVFMMQAKVDDAVKEAAAVTAAKPDDARAHVVAGYILSEAGRHAEAIQAFDRAVELEPNEQTYLARASQRSLPDHAGRQSDVDAVLKLNPESIAGLVFRAQLQSDLGQYANAAATYTAALEMERMSSELLIARGIAYAKARQMNLANKDFKAVREQANSPLEQNNVCYALAAGGVELPMALDLCKAAVSKEPKAAGFQDSLGLVLLRLNRYQESIEAYDVALAVEPGLSLSQYGRGIAKQRAGDRAGSDADLQAAIARDTRVAETFASFGVTP